MPAPPPPAAAIRQRTPGHQVSLAPPQMPLPVRLVSGGVALGAVVNVLAVAALISFGITAAVAAGSSPESGELGVTLMVAAVLLGLVAGVAAAVQIWSYRALRRGNRAARAALTGLLALSALGAVVAAAVGDLGLGVGLLLRVMIGGAWLSLLWLPESSRRFFGDHPPVTATGHAAPWPTPPSRTPQGPAPVGSPASASTGPVPPPCGSRLPPPSPRGFLTAPASSSSHPTWPAREVHRMSL